MRRFYQLLVFAAVVLGWLAGPAAIIARAQVVINVELNKSFTPIVIPAGGISRMRVTIFNTNTFQLTNAAWSDNLISVQPGLRLANPVNLVSDCGGSVSAPAGGTTISLTGGIVPPQVGMTLGSCTVEVDVTSTISGNLVNTILAGALTGIGNGLNITNATPASATLRVEVVQPPSVNKTFNASTVYVGQNSLLTITIRNTDTVNELTQVNLTDAMPAGVVLSSTPYVTPLSGCGASASLTAVAGSSSLSLNNGRIAANGTCTIRVYVLSTSPGSYVNTIPAGDLQTQQGVTNLLASATLNVQAIGIAKSFSPATMQAGGVSTVTITLRNPSPTVLTGVSLTDVMPPPNPVTGNNLTVVAGSAATTCTGGVATAVAPNSVTLTGATIPAGSIATPATCTITVQVTLPGGSPAASYNNTIPVGSLVTNEGITNNLQASATLSIYPTGGGLTASKSFTPSSILAGQSSRLRLSLTAPVDTAPTGLTNFSITDSLPPGMTVSNSTAPVLTSCGAAVFNPAPQAGDTSFNVTNATISTSTACLIDVYVTTASGGSYLNSIPPANISNTQNRRPSGNINATLTVSAPSDLTMSKVFYPDRVNPNGLSTLTVTLQNNNTSPLTNVSLNDPLPFVNVTTGVFVAPTPNSITTCGPGVVSVVTNANQSQNVLLTGGVIPARVGGVPGICTITIDVIGRGANATRTNTIPITNVSATIQSSGVTIAPQAAASANLVIASLSIGVVKGFQPLTVYGGSASQLSIQLTNPTNALLTGINFTDTMPENMVIANPPNLNTGTCGGVLTGTPGSRIFSFSGGTLNAASNCTLTLSVTMTINNNLTNVIPVGAVTTFNGASNSQQAQATLTNLPGASVSKVFAPNPIVAGLSNYSLLTITIQNTGNTLITNIGLNDTLPVGLQVAPNPAPVNNCGGTLTADAGTRPIRLENGSLPGSSSCTLVVPVTGAAPGSYLNTIPAGALTNANGATNTLPAEDILVLTSAPSIDIQKDGTAVLNVVAPDTRLDVGDQVTYIFTVTNTGNVTLTNITLADTVGGVTISGGPIASLSPGASDNTTYTGSYTLTQADLDAGVFSNTATVSGNPPSGAPVTDSGSNVQFLPPVPAMTLVKTGTLNLDVVAPNGVANVGDTISYAFTVTNTGNVTLTGITIADTIGGVTITGGPVTLLPGASDATTFTGSYTLTQADIDAGSFTNTATASGNPPSGDPVTAADDDTRTILSAPALALAKSVTSSGPYSAGGTVTYSLVATNIGNVTLSGVAITDAGAGVTLGVCTPAQPAALAPGATLTCSAEHVVAQGDVDAGGFTNIASADSDQTAPVTDDASITILANPTITLVKTGVLNLDVVAPNGIANPGDTISYTFTVTNSGNVTLTGITLADTVGGVTISGGPISLTPGASDATTFTGVYTLTQADIDAGTFTNTATANGNPPSGGAVTGTDDDTQTIAAAPALNVAKTVTSAGPYVLGSTVTYAIVATNTGNVTLTGVGISDTGLGACTPAQPAALAPGATLTCTASHTVTQGDVDAGGYTNTAMGDSDQTAPVTDEASITITRSPALTLAKTGTLNLDVVAPNGIANPGDTITYAFTVTNSGNVTLFGITLADTIGGVTITDAPVTLLPGASDAATFTGSYTLTQADIDAGTFINTATASANPPSGGAVTAFDDDTQTLPAAPALTFAKTVTSSGPYALGSTVTYSLVATNTGNVTLDDVTITDAGLVTCTPTQPAALAPGATLTCSAEHVVTQGDVDAGGYTNIASADSNQTTPVTDDASISILRSPAVTLEKTGTLNLDASAPTGIANPGDTIAYAFTVTNTGNVTLTGITISDTVGGVTISGGPVTLAAGVSDTTSFTGVYTLTQSDIDAGTFTNTATVSANPPSGGAVTGTDDDTRAIPSAAGISLEKTGALNLDVVAPNGIANVGDTITYAFTVTNTGNVTLTGITVADTVGGVTISGGPITLAPGASDNTTFTGTYTLTLTDIDAGSFTNTATASANPPAGAPVTATDDDTQTLPGAPAIALVKTGTLDLDVIAPNGVANVGDTITYTFTVTNTGNVTLTGITVTDIIGGVTISGGPISLAPGTSDTTTFTGTYTLTQFDINAGTFTNTATTSGNPPVGSPVTGSDDDTQTIAAAPALELVKTGTLNPDVVAPNGDANVGDTISYVFTVTNTGNVTLTGITLADTIGGVTISGGPIASLAPGVSDNTTFTGIYTLTLADINNGSFDNTAAVTGEPPSGSPVSDEGESSVDLPGAPALTLVKTGTLDRSVVAPDDVVNPGDTITYAFTITNSGNVTLTDITLTDSVCGTVTGGPIASLEPGAVDNTTFTCSYTVTQDDINAESFTNTATASGSPPTGSPVSGTDEYVQPLEGAPALGVAKRVVGEPELVTTGVFDVTFDILVRNYGNLPFSSLQVTDDLVATFPPATLFSVQSLTSADFTVNAVYDGNADTNLLAGTDALDISEEGNITLVVRVTPADGGPFENTAIAIGETPAGDPVEDDSQEGADPDPDDDGNPGNNDEPTPVDFGPNLFDPPFGVKTFDANRLPLLRWNVVWINDSNITAISAASSDPIPNGTRFYDDGVPSGYPLPPGTLPADSTTNGVACLDSSTITTTTYCYYEGPTSAYPRGRIVWEGTLGPDFGITDPVTAQHDIQITFAVRLNTGVQRVNNTATVDADLNGDGDVSDPGEVQVADANAVWLAEELPDELPDTGFAPGVVTRLPQQPAERAYRAQGDLTLEIPALKVNAPIVGVPLTGGDWQLDWLGGQIGHLDGTAFPTWNGNAALTAHVYDANGKPGPFVNLGSLRWGQQIIVHLQGQKYIFEVRSVRTQVSPDADVITHEEMPVLTLITCQGYDEDRDSYRWRVVVRAVLVKVE